MASVPKHCALLIGALLGLSQTTVAEAQESVPPLQVEAAVPRVTALQPLIHKDLAIYPLTATTVADTSRYKHLDVAVSDKSVEITEWGSGTVPHLKVTNKGNSKVFVMAGEIMTGAKQDRMSAHDVLLPPRSGAIKLPVYCVEQGRWVLQGKQFAAGRTAGTKQLRKSAVEKSSQGKIWSDVAAKAAESGVQSSTGTMQAVYNNPELQRRIRAYQQAFADLPSKAPNMVGFVVAVRGQIDTADLFASPPLLLGLWKKLVKAAATDAVTSRRAPQSVPSVTVAQAFLDLGLRGNGKRIKNPGVGEEYLIEAGGGVTGSTLIHQAKMVHLALFAPDRSVGPRELRNGIQHGIPQTSRASSSRVKEPHAPSRTPDTQKGNAKKSQRSWPKSKSQKPGYSESFGKRKAKEHQ